jgi:hypothetical protein
MKLIKYVALYGVETWTLRKVDKKYLGRCEMWCWKKNGYQLGGSCEKRSITKGQEGEEYPTNN